MASLPPYEPFRINIDPQSVGTRWVQWLSGFENLLEALDVIEKEDDKEDRKLAIDRRRKAVLLYYAGEEVVNVFNGIPEKPEEKNTFSKLKPLLNKYFLSKKNLELEIFRFRQLRQDDSETMDIFATRLRVHAQRCEFQDLEAEVKLQIIQGCKSSAFRKLFLREKMPLTKMLDHARSSEAADLYEENLQKNSDQSAMAVNTRNFKSSAAPETPKSKTPNVCRNCGGPWPHNSSPCTMQNRCRNCGRSWPHQADKPCPAKGKTCSRCGKFYHFAEQCRSSQMGKSTSRTDHVHQVQEGDSSDESVLRVQSKGESSAITQIEICGNSIPMMIDTGTTCNLLSKKTYKTLRNAAPLEPVENEVTAYGKRKISILGSFTTLLTSKYASVLTTVCVSNDEDAECLLSRKISEELGLVIFTNVVSTEDGHSRLKKDFPKLFCGLGKLEGHQVKLYIDSSVAAVTPKHRRVGFHLRKAMAEELDRLLENDIIEPVLDGPTPWVSPCLIVPKPKQPGKYRVCVDMRAPNKAIRTRHVIPTVEDLIVDLNGTKFFSKLDMNQGYHQLELHPDSRFITTFATHRGLFRYKRLNFGINCASEIFDDIVRQIVIGIPGVINRSDDILVTGKNKEVHDLNLKEVLRRLSEKNITLNFEKCEFEKKQLTFYGLKFSAEGLAPDEDKIKAINDTPQPESAEGVASFLGMITFCSRFIKDAASIAEPLRKLTHQDNPWVWGPQEEYAFQELKKRLREATTLAYYNIEKPTALIVDASQKGLGAILAQVSKDAVAFASRRLTDVESRYSQTEREALAITWAILHFHLYVAGKSFKAITDHKPLVTLFNKPQIQPPARIERSVLKLQQYEFSVEYRPGKHNPADFMSRHPILDTSVSSREETLAENYINSVCLRSEPKTVSLQEIADASENDKSLQAIMKILKKVKQSGPLDLNEAEGKRFKVLKQCMDQMSVIPRQKREFVLKGTKIVTPDALADRLVEVAHRNHLGIVKTKGLLREKVWFPNMDQLVESKIDHCIPCQSCSTKNQPEPLQMSTLPALPWTEVSIDFAEMPNGEYLLVAYDDYSRYSVVSKVSSTSAAAVTPKLDEVFSLFGIPETAKSDNGPPFNSAELAQFAKSMDFQHRKVTPCWPQANGGVERFMRTIKKALRCAVAEGANWKQRISSFLLDYRAAPHPSTGKSPGFLMFGRPMRTKLPQLPAKPSNDEVRERDATYKSKVKMHADKQSKHREIQVGDVVLLKRDKITCKLQTPFYTEPFKVIQQNGTMITVENGSRHVTRNVTFFRKYHGDIISDDQNHVQENDEEFLTVPEDEPPEINAPNEIQPLRHSHRERRPPRNLQDFVLN